MNPNKIIPSLWFTTDDGNSSIVIDYYKNIFGSDFEEGNIARLGETPSGNTEMCEVMMRQKNDIPTNKSYGLSKPATC